MAYIYDGNFYIAQTGDGVTVSTPGDGTEVHLPMDVFDAIVLMRSAQLSEELEKPGDLYVRMIAACDRGTLGAEALRRWLQIPSAMGT